MDDISLLQGMRRCLNMEKRVRKSLIQIEMGNVECVKDKRFPEAEGFIFQHQEVWIVSLGF